MTLTVELTPEEETQLNIQAQKIGIDLAEYVRSLIVNARQRDDSGIAVQKTGAEVLEELKAMNLPPGYGDPSIDSPELARRLSAQFSSRGYDKREIDR